MSHNAFLDVFKQKESCNKEECEAFCCVYTAKGRSSFEHAEEEDEEGV